MTGEQAIPGDARSGGRRDRQLLAWGVIGVLAQAAFLAGWLIAEMWQGPRYSPVADTISDLQAATAPHYWFPLACFAAGGLGTFGFAVLGLRPALAGAGRTAARAPWMLACAALALGNSFPLIPCRLADPGCTAHHQLYSPGGLTDAVVSGIAFLVLALTPSVGSAQGLAERILATACVLWMGTLAINLILVSRDHPSATRTGSVMSADQLAPQHRPRRGLATAWRRSRCNFGVSPAAHRQRR